MKINQIKKQYSKINWYKQGAVVRPFYNGHPYRACLGFTIYGKRVRSDFLPFSVFQKNDFMDVYFPKDHLYKIGMFYYGQEKKKPGLVLQLKKRWEKNEVVTLLRIIDQIEKTRLGSLNNDQLLKIFDEFSKIYVSLWREAIFLDAFDVASESILDEALREENKNIKKEDLEVLTSSVELSWIQKEKSELIELVVFVKKNPKLSKFLVSKNNKIEKDLPVLFPHFFEKLKNHADRYHWIYNDYAVIRRLDWKFFLKNAQEFLRDVELLRRERQAIDFVLKTAEKKKNIFKKIKFSSKFIDTIDFLTVLASWRDSRKAYNQTASGALFGFAKEFQKRTGLSKDEVEYFWWWEIKDIFRISKKGRRIYQERKRGMFCVGDPAKITYYGKEAEEMQAFMAKLLSNKKDLRGRPAFGGMVRGRAKIILSQKDFYKMEKGDILVAPNTRPEYVPIMKIAGALVSEEGGLTCHTAIVARELKIPAIVGVQGAIAALKDGDLVEVDAEKGVVRILKRKI